MKTFLILFFVGILGAILLPAPFWGFSLGFSYISLFFWFYYISFYFCPREAFSSPRESRSEPNNGIDRKEFVLDNNGLCKNISPIKCSVEIGHEIWFTADGYGDHCSQDGQGSILMIENKNGALMLYVWDDINEEEPRLISLANAKESNRK